MGRRETILLIEDNRKLLGAVRRMLELRGYEAFTAVGVEGGRRALAESRPDLVVLDVMLPDGNGVDFCREIRASSDVPVLFLTAMDATADVVRALEAGGDAYVTKPFDFEELAAHVAALLRRRRWTGGQEAGDATAPPSPAESLRASLEERGISLTATEYALLAYLAEKRRRGVPSREIYGAVWGMEPGDDVRAVKQCIYALRRKLEKSGVNVRLEYRRGEGYRLAWEG